MSHSAETRAKLLAAHWSRCPVKRAAVIAKLSATLQGRSVGAETRIRMSAAHLLTPPPADVDAMIELYPAMGLIPLSQRMGYDRRVIERVLRERGVTIRPAGFQPGNRMGRA